MVPRTDDVDRFYQAAHLGLLILDARSPRRRFFGGDVEARWGAFAGDMDDWDRLDLCLRDAAVQFPAAFAPRVVFALEGLAGDEPFGERWPRPAGQQARTLFHPPPGAAVPLAPASLGELLQRVASIWGLSLAEPPASQLDGLTVASRLRVEGAGALAAVARCLAQIDASNLVDQVTLVAHEPGERQLFGLAAAFSRAPGEARILTPAQASSPGPVGERLVTSVARGEG